MQGKRKDRIGHLIQMELSRLILSRLKDPRLGLLTITHVEMGDDLKSACVFYTVLGAQEIKQETQEALEHSAGFLQKEIALVLRLRYTPKLKFRFDSSLDQGMEIDRILRKIHTEEHQDS